MLRNLLLREEDNEQNVQVMVSSTKNHEERNPGLKDVVFSWSIRDIMNNNLYKNEVRLGLMILLFHACMH